MGYTFHAGEENQINALTIANERKIDLAKKQTNRNVYRQGLCRGWIDTDILESYKVCVWTI